MKHLPGEACSAMQHILITATSNYREEGGEKITKQGSFPPPPLQKKTNTRHLRYNRNEAALTIRPEAASSSALKGRWHQDAEPTRKERELKGEIRERLIAHAKGMQILN